MKTRIYHVLDNHDEYSSNAFQSLNSSKFVYESSQATVRLLSSYRKVNELSSLFFHGENVLHFIIIL